MVHLNQTTIYELEEPSLQASSASENLSSSDTKSTKTELFRMSTQNFPGSLDFRIPNSRKGWLVDNVETELGMH